MLPVSEFEYELILTVNRATFVPGSAHKRFIREFADGRRLHLSARGRQYLATIAHRYRRQYHLSDAQWAWIREWLSCSIPADERQMPRINSVSERPAQPGEASAVKAGACEPEASAPGLS